MCAEIFRFTGNLEKEDQIIISLIIFFKRKTKPPTWVLGIINISRSQITNQQLSVSCRLLMAMVCFCRTPEDLKHAPERGQLSVFSINPRTIFNW